MRLLHYFGLLALLIFSCSASAETYSWYRSGLSQYAASTPEQACIRYITEYKKSTTLTFSRFVFTEPTGGFCYVTNNSTGAESNYTSINRFGDSCPSGYSYNSNTGGCEAPAQQDGELCNGTTDHVDVTQNSVFDAAAGKCVPFTQTSKKTECAYLGNYSKRTFDLVAVATVSSSGSPVAPKIVSEPGSAGIACSLDVVSATDCKIDTAGKATCKVTAKYNGQVGDAGITEKEPLCGTSGQACPDTTSQTTEDNTPCTYSTVADGSQTCTSKKETETTGEQQCSGSWGSVQGTPTCVTKKPSSKGIEITTTVKTDQKADGGTVTTKTDVSKTTTCTDVNSCKTTSTTTTTQITKDSNGVTVGSTTTTIGDGKGVSNGTDTNGDGTCDTDCGEGAIEAQDWYEKTDDTYEGVMKAFSAKVQSSAVFQAPKTFFDASGIGGSCPVYEVTAWVFTVRLDQWCTANIPWDAIRAIVIACAGFVAFRWALL